MQARSLAISLAVMVAAMAVGCGSGEARARKRARPIFHIFHAAQSVPLEKPVRMRYYGGPKSPMYPG
jgi:hypothetical protein